VLNYGWQKRQSKSAERKWGFAESNSPKVGRGELSASTEDTTAAHVSEKDTVPGSDVDTTSDGGKG